MIIFLKKIGFFFATLTLTAFIFWLAFMDKQSKTETLDYTLGLLGNKLVAMIPDKSDRKPVQEKFENFVKQAKEQKVSTEQVEHVAANILNLSNAETELTTEQAEAVIELSLAAPLIASQSECEVEEICPPSEPEKWKNLEKRIKFVYDMNDKMQEVISEDSEKKYNLKEQYEIQVKDGLILAMNNDVKNEFLEVKVKNLQDELKKLEDEHIVYFNKNFQDKNLKELKQHGKSLNYIIALKKLEEANINTKILVQSVKVLKDLPQLSVIPVINADSLEIVIEKNNK